MHLSTLDKYMPNAHPDREVRRLYFLGWGLSTVFYILLFVLFFIQGINSQFGNIQVVDQQAERQYRVAWIESGKKLQYPVGFFAPLHAKSLAEIEQEQELAAKRKKERERRRALAEARKREELAKDTAGKKDQSGDSSAAGSTGGANNAPPSSNAADSKVPTVAVNIFPLREHIDEVVDKYRNGQLKVNPNALRGTIGVTLDANGDFKDVKVLSSTGSRDADEAAKAFLKEVMAQSGMKPFLSKFSSIKISVDANNSDVTLSVTGNTTGGMDATTIAGAITTAAFFKKASVPKDSNTAKVLNNLKVQHSGSEVTATISLPRSMAGDVMRDFGKKPTASKT